MKKIFTILTVVALVVFVTFLGYDCLDRSVRYEGRLSIPAVSLDVACYNSHEQYRMDRWDYANMFEYDMRATSVLTGDISNVEATYIIADHNNQGFSAIGNCTVGDEAYFTHGDGRIDKYTVISTFKGHNTQDDLTDWDYSPIGTEYHGCLILYTCLDDWTNVQIVILQPV